MQPRLNITKAAPDAYKAAAALDTHIFKEGGLEANVIHLVKIRASQINGCAYCVDMHVKEARRHGFGEQWMHMISVWRESPVFSDKERAVLGWTEALTLLAETRAPDADFEAMRAHFSDEEIGKITVAIGTINVWNRIAVGLRTLHPVERTEKAAA